MPGDLAPRCSDGLTRRVPLQSRRLSVYRRTFMRRNISSLLFLALTTSAFSQQSPTTMTKAVIRLQNPNAKNDSFTLKPKTMYRAGTTYCRIEAQPDPERGIHGVVVINGPDVWMVNLLTKTARHMIDPGRPMAAVCLCLRAVRRQVWKLAGNSPISKQEPVRNRARFFVVKQPTSTRSMPAIPECFFIRQARLSVPG